MGTYRYKALSPEGNVVGGSVEAASEEAAAAWLRHDRLLLIAITAAGRSRFDKWSIAARYQRIGARARLPQAIRELATFLQAGLPLDRALALLVEMADFKLIAPHLAGISDRVRGGASMADAMAVDPVFPQIVVSLVRAGESGGSLAGTLTGLAEYLLRAQNIREAVVSALIYPALLTVAGLLSTLVIILFVLPQFEPLFLSSGKEMPTLLAVMLGLRKFLSDWGAEVIAAVAIALPTIWRANPALAARFDAGLLRLPMVGPTLTLVQLERLTRSLGTLLTNGQDLPVALAIARETLTNRKIAAALEASVATLREGQSLERTLARVPHVPGFTLDLIRVGEETGQLGEMLVRHADICEHRLRHRIDRGLTMLVPALTIFFGIVVAGLVASMIIAILAVNDLAL